MRVIILLCILTVMAEEPEKVLDNYESDDGDTDTDDADTLRLLQILFRHGDRSPISAYANDIYEESDWPQGYGQLSTLGMQQELELGEFLRQEYVDTGFLSPEFTRSEIYVRSTAYDRTLMSAYSVLAGLFPPTQGDSEWNREMNWQPIPVHTVPLDEDFLLHTDTACPVYKSAKANDPEVKAFEKQVMNDFRDFFSYVSKHSGQPNTWNGVSALIDSIFCQYASNYSLPDWVTDDILDKFLRLHDIGSTLARHPKKYVYLKGGSLVGEMLKHMINKSQPDTFVPQKLFMYSAHDTTVESFLATLGIFNDLVPGYTACVLVELHEVEPGEFAVQFLYKNDTDRAPYSLTIPNCDELCSLDKFAQIMQPWIPKDIKKECGVESSESSQVPAATVKHADASSIIVIVELCLIVLMMILAAIFCWVKRDKLAETHDYMPVPLEMS